MNTQSLTKTKHKLKSVRVIHILKSSLQKKSCLLYLKINTCRRSQTNFIFRHYREGVFHCLYIYFFLLLLVKYSCLHFPTMTFLCSTYCHLPPLILPTFGFVHRSFIHVPWRPFPFFPPLSLSPLLSGYHQFVPYFNASGYILLVCLFC